jgi:hypothetical protein
MEVFTFSSLFFYSREGPTPSKLHKPNPFPFLLFFFREVGPEAFF